MPLTENLLRADSPTDLRHVAGFTKVVGGADDVAVFQLEKRTGDVVVDGAGFDAGRRRALDATMRLEFGELELESQIGLVPIRDPYSRVLLGHGLGRDPKPLFAVNLDPGLGFGQGGCSGGFFYLLEYRAVHLLVGKLGI
jgi:hypothetical protein